MRLPGVGCLIGFLSAAGVHVEPGRRGSLRINGIQTLPLAGIRPLPQVIGWNSFIDGIALRYARGSFVKAVADNALFGEGLRTFLRPREKGFAIMRGEVRLAMIHPTRAYVAHRKVIEANFLTPGAHWRQVADVLPGAEADLMAERKRDQESRAAEGAAVTRAQAQRRPRNNGSWQPSRLASGQPASGTRPGAYTPTHARRPSGGGVRRVRPAWQ